MRVLVIGCGLAGVTCAYFLRRQGADVTVLERAEGPGLGTSYANGAVLHASFVQPWNGPGVLRELLRCIGREDSPMLLRPRALPSLIGWGLEFFRQSVSARFESNTLRNLALGQYSLQMMQLVRAETEIQYDQSFRGLVALFRSAAAFHKGRASASALGARGVAYAELDVEALVALEPALRPVAHLLEGGIHFPGDEGGDAYRFCCGLAEFAVHCGVDIRFGVDVRRFERRGTRITGVVTEQGDMEADVYVLAAGSYSTILARSAGLALPVRPVKGYSITLPRAASCSSAPQVPVIDMELHAAVVPIGADRVRVAGTAEFAGYDLRIRQPRIDNLFRLLRESFPDYAAQTEASRAQTWAGLRPVSADGVPLIGATRMDNLYLNTGHGHLGWTLAAGSGKLLADIVCGREPALPPAQYRLDRF